MTTTTGRSTGFHVLMVALVCAATAFILATPGFVMLAAAQWQYGPAQIGMLVTADSIASALGPLVLSGAFARAPVRRTLATCALAFGLANVGTALHPDLTLTLVLRAVSGFSSGVLAALGVRYLALSAHSERNLTWLVISQTLYSTLLLALVLPAIGAQGQATGAFALLAVQGLLAIGMARLFRPGERPMVEASAGGAVNRAGALLGLAAIVGLNTAVGVVWTFIDHQGVAAGVSPEGIERLLGAANVLSIFPCALVPLAIRRGQLFNAAIAMLLCCTVAAGMLTHPATPTAFAAGSLLFVVAWAVAATLLMATVPLYDQAGRYVMVIPSALCIGNGLGASIGGHLMEGFGPASAFAFAAGCCALAAALFVLLRLRSEPQSLEIQVK